MKADEPKTYIKSAKRFEENNFGENRYSNSPRLMFEEKMWENLCNKTSLVWKSFKVMQEKQFGETDRFVGAAGKFKMIPTCH